MLTAKQRAIRDRSRQNADDPSAHQAGGGGPDIVNAQHCSHGSHGGHGSHGSHGGW